MTLAKSTSNDAASFGISSPDAIAQRRTILEKKISNLATQATNNALSLWAQYQPVTADKAQAVWQLLRRTQPVQLLLSAALAVLAIALVTLVTTFSGVIVLFLKLAALVLAAVAVWQWIARGLSWADEKLPSSADISE